MNFLQKCFTFIFFMIVTVSALKGQTYLGIGMGYDYTQINKGENVEETREFSLFLTEDKYLAGSVFGSLMIEQQLSPKNYISVNLSYYAKKDAPARWIAVIAPAKALRINLVRIKALFRQEILGNFHVGAGLGVGFNSVRVVYSGGSVGDTEGIPISGNTSYDTHLVIGYNYKHFLMELGYQKGFRYQDDYSYFVEPMDAYSFTVSYLLKVSKENKKRDKNARF